MNPSVPPVSPAPSQGHSKPEGVPGVHLQPEWRYMVVFIQLQEQQDRGLESYGRSGCMLWLLYRRAIPLTAEDPLWLVTVCERGIKLSKSMAEWSTQLRTPDGLAQLCVVALHCFFCLYWKRCTHVLQRAKTWRCFHFPCTASADISSLCEHSFLLHKKAQTRWGCTVTSRTTHSRISGCEAWSPLLPPFPLLGQMLSAVCYSRLPWACSPGLPKCVLSFWQEGLGDPETDLLPAPAAPRGACLALTFPALRPLPFPPNLLGLFLLCLLQEKAPLLLL